jgi:hypothetical protein
MVLYTWSPKDGVVVCFLFWRQRGYVEHGEAMTKKDCLNFIENHIWTADLCRFCTLPNCEMRRKLPLMKKITPHNKRFYLIYEWGTKHEGKEA